MLRTWALWAAAGVLAVMAPGASAQRAEPIRVGIIFSESGTMMTSERPLLAATRVAIDDINLSGGILGRRIEPIIVDGASTPEKAAREAARLIDDGVAAIFGCWTSACRKAVMQVVEDRRSVLFYPVQYEGTGFGDTPRDPSPRVIYSGAAPNQQIVPGVRWALQALPQGEAARVFLVGSDYIFPRSANAQIRQLVDHLGGKIVAERYEPLGQADFDGLARALDASGANVIFNTVNGLDNSSLFEVLSRIDPSGERFLTLSFSVEETQIREIGAGRFVNRYAAWNYFHSPRNPGIGDFLPRYRAYLGTDDAQTSDPVEAAYLQMMIFAEAARRAGSVAPDDVLRSARGLVLPGFSEVVRVDPDNQHLWKAVEIRRFGAMRTFEPVWRSAYPIRPDPAPNLAAPGEAVVQAAFGEELALRQLSSDLPERRLSALLYLRSSSARGLPYEALSRSLTLNRDWSEQLLAAQILAERGGTAGQQELARALERNADNNFTLMVLSIVASLDPATQAAPEALLSAIGQVLQTNADPVVRKTAIRALGRFPSSLPPHLRGVLLAGGTSVDPSVAVEAVRVLGASPAIPAPALEASSAILARSDITTAPALGQTFCDTLDNIGEGYGDAPDNQSASAYIRIIASLPAPLQASCEGAIAHAEAMKGNAFLRQLAAIMPNTLQGWLTLFALVIPIGLVTFKLGQMGYIFLFPASGIRHVRPFRPSRIPLLNTLSKQSLDILGVARLPARRRSAIGAWIRANQEALQTCSLPASGVRAPYQPLLVTETIDGETTSCVPDEAYFRKLLESPNCRGEILGEGGVGKSSFALELLRVAGLADSTTPRIGVFLPANAIADPEKTDSILEAIQARLRTALQAKRGRSSNGVETDDLEFVRRLLADGHIVLVIDDLPRFVDQQWRLSAGANFNLDFDRIFYTGRTDIATLDRTIAPLSIDRQRVMTFVDTHLTMVGDKPLTDAEKAELADNLESLFAGRNTVPALFAKMTAEEVQRRRPNGAELGELALSMPEMVLSHVQYAFARLPREELIGIDLREYWRPVGALSWVCISTGLQVAPVSEDGAREALKPHGDANMLLKLICAQTQLGHFVANERIVIASDALSEYLAALWTFDAKAPDRWPVVRARIEAVLGGLSSRTLSLPTQTFLSALLDVADRSGADGRATLDRTSAPAGAARVIEGWLARSRMDAGEIKVGVLHSETGEMAISERPVIEATLLAIERVNARGGISGRRLVPVRHDGASDPAAFAEGARQMLAEGVACIFGCWTSASRIEVLRVLEKEGRGLLFYPVQYEGYEAHPRALYFGAAPNQQLLPAIDWCVGNGARSFLLIGSDYVFPRIANEIMMADLQRRSGDGVRTVADPLYVPLREGWSFDALIAAIRKDPPDFILNTVNGLANLEFFWRLWELRNGPDGERFAKIKVMSLSMGDYEVQRIGAEIAAGHYASWTYFSSLEGAANAAFLRAMRTRKGIFFPSDPAEAAYVQVTAFADATSRLIEDGDTITSEAIRKKVLGAQLSAPSGQLEVDPSNGHLHKIPRIGELSADGIFQIVWEHPGTVKPDPSPFPELNDRIAAIRTHYHTS